MATPGIGDPYWFEWYVGLKNIINMLNPDNGIEYVIFQCSKYNTIDDVRFERIASPIREAMHEKYYRQPILFRWLCNSEWLKETLCKHNLHLRYVSRLESIP